MHLGPINMLLCRVEHPKEVLLELYFFVAREVWHSAVLCGFV